MSNSNTAKKLEDVGSNSNAAKKGGVILAIGAIATLLVQQASFIVLPAMDSLSKYYTQVPYSQILLITTLVYLGIVPFSIISGSIAGNRIGYKKLAIIGTAIVMVGGVMPFFTRDNFTLILASRALCGVGQGLAFPLCNALILRLFKGEERSRYLGASVVVLNLSGVFYQMVAGWVCDINLHYIWLVHLVLIVPILMIIFMLKEPNKDDIEEQDVAVTSGTSNKPYFSMRVVAICVGFFCWFVFMYTVALNMSSIIVYNKIGTAATAGLAGSANSVAGILSGACYALLFRNLKKFMLPVGLTISVIGLGLMGYATNVPMVMISQFCMGFATFTVATVCARDFDAFVSPAGIALANGILASVWNLSAFSTTYFIALINAITGSQNPVTCVRIAAWGALAVGVIWTIIRMMRPKKYQTE